MADIRAVLVQFILDYLKAKDVVAKQIIAVKHNEQGVDAVVEGVLNTRFVLAMPELTDEQLKRLTGFKDRHVVLVTANTQKNLDFLINKWDELVQFPHLSVHFVNPNSNTERRWTVFPATHDRITERSSLRKGLESLFSTVEEWKE